MDKIFLSVNKREDGPIELINIIDLSRKNRQNFSHNTYNSKAYYKLGGHCWRILWEFPYWQQQADLYTSAIKDTANMQSAWKLSVEEYI